MDMAVSAIEAKRLEAVLKGDEEVEVVGTGTDAVAYALMLADIDVTAAYPIRPYGGVMERTARLIADGYLKAEYIVAAHEHDQFEIVKHASAVGARTFVGSSGVGWLLAIEAIVAISTDRYPVVALIGNRALDDPGAYGVEHNDALMVRDVGWLLVWVDTAQEALDTTLIAYRIAEDPRVMLPVGISMDGAFLTHSEHVFRIPPKSKVQKFLPPYDLGNRKLHPSNVISVAPQVNEDWVTELRKQMDEAMKNARRVIEEAYRDYAKIIGRDYGNPFVEPYMVDDADVIMVGMGTVSKPIKEAVRRLRAKGERVGFLRIRWFRPFPTDDIIRYLTGAKAVAVVDRDYSFGSPFDGGALYTEIRSALYEAEHRPLMINFIGGLGGREITYNDAMNMFNITLDAARKGKVEQRVIWYGVRE
jgi:pyruvate ferredoxin oxidoreductase alpha subunit